MASTITNKECKEEEHTILQKMDILAPSVDLIHRGEKT